MKHDATKSSLEFKRNGITVLIRPTQKNGFERFVLDYRIKGKRKQVWRSTFADARQAANDAIDKINAGQSDALSLTNADVHVYLRAKEAADTLGIALDTLALNHAEVFTMLAGRATPSEAARFWLKRHDASLPPKTMTEACAECLEVMRANSKSEQRVRQLKGVFKRLGKDVNIQVAEVTPSIISQWLSGLATHKKNAEGKAVTKALSEKSRRNHRDAVGFLNRWLVMRGYLAKGTDWLENVQQYSNRKQSEIEIFTSEEVAKLISAASEGMLPFIAIQAFAGLRHAEVARLDWSEIDLDDGFIEVRALKSKTGERRLVPIQPNLKNWLLPLRKERGPVCPYAQTAMQLLKIAADSGVEWKQNGLRHSFISYRVAATADVPRVADEAGNSPQIIRGHYLRRVKPAEAARWFSIAPEQPENITALPHAVSV